MIFSLPLSAATDKLFILISYYDGLGTKMRTETVVRYGDNCGSEKVAEVIFIDQTNEIREAAMIDEKGWWKHQPINEAKGMKKIVELFKKASFKKADCLSEKSSANNISDERPSDDELNEKLKQALRPIPSILSESPKEKLE